MICSFAKALTRLACGGYHQDNLPFLVLLVEEGEVLVHVLEFVGLKLFDPFQTNSFYFQFPHQTYDRELFEMDVDYSGDCSLSSFAFCYTEEYTLEELIFA